MLSVVLLETAHLLHRRYGLCDFYNCIPAPAQTNILYFATDTHWNNLGVELAVQKTLEVWPK